MRLKYIYLATAILIGCFAYALTDSGINNSNDVNGNASISMSAQTTPAEDFPQMLPASPKVSSIMKYGQYPVSLYTGLVDITVPVYTIKVNDIEVPIEFKYHASGIRFDDLSLEVGLGWSLIAGGLIEFQARGSKDGISYNSSAFVKNANSINTYGNCNNDDLRSLMGISQGNKFYFDNYFSYDIKDGETDIYNYHFLQYSGQFFNPYIENDNTKLGHYVFSPANPLSASGNGTGGIPFIIKDDKVIEYLFEFTEPNNFQPPRRRESYYLTRIVSADKADTVKFNYTYYSQSPANVVRKPRINSTVTIKETHEYDPPGSSYEYPVATPDYKTEDYYPGRLNSITFRGGRVEFGYLNNSAESRDLRNVKIFNNISSTPLQTITLEKTLYSVNRGERLDKVTFQNQQGDSYNYQFGYNGNPVANPGSVDYWGYNNGSAVSNSFNHVPNFTVSILGTVNYTLSTTNRSANEASMQSGILNKITYPTKGYTEFIYEAHRANNQIYGGLRIKEIRNYDSNGTLAEKKWYQYGISGEGRAAAYPKADDFQITSRIIEQYMYNGITKFRTHTYRQFLSFPRTSYFSSGSSVVYPVVTEFVGDANTDTGKTVYYFEDFSDESVSGYALSSGLPDMPLRTFGWKTGKLKSKTVYKKENNTYTEIYSLTNTYIDKNTSEYLNLRVSPFISLITHADLGAGDESIYYCYDMTTHSAYKAAFGGNTPFDYYNYYLTTGLRVLESSVEKADGLTKNVSYIHNSSGYPTEISTVLSSGKTQKVNYKYPADMTGNVYANIRNKSAVIETREYLDNSLTAFHRTQYGSNHPANANLTAPISEDYQRGDQITAETRITYNLYDLKGNILHITKDNAEQVVYLWGYNNLYPIAEIKGATYSDVTGKVVATTLNSIAAKDNLSALDSTTINNLRTQLPNAQVTTFTYKPLVGIASKTDPRGVVTRYEYDSFGRLLKATEAGKVVEAYEYHYKN